MRTCCQSCPYATRLNTVPKRHLLRIENVVHQLAARSCIIAISFTSRQISGGETPYPRPSLNNLLLGSFGSSLATDSVPSARACSSAGRFRRDSSELVLFAAIHKTKFQLFTFLLPHSSGNGRRSCEAVGFYQRSHWRPTSRQAIIRRRKEEPVPGTRAAKLKEMSARQRTITKEL